MSRRKRAQFFCPCCGIHFTIECHASGMVSTKCDAFIINPEFYPEQWEEEGAKGNVRPGGVSAGVDAKKGSEG